jgi:HD-like signal output (HDOD) protein
LPDNLKTCIKFLKEGELSKASKSVEDDPALNNYLVHIVNKPIYGFSQEVKNTVQIFGILGLVKTRQMLTSYLISLLAPKKWELFGIDNLAFNEFQAAMMGNWNRILDSLGYENNAMSTSATLLASAIVVCEALFKDKKGAVELIRERNYVDYSTILKHLTGYTLFDIAIMIGERWEIDDDALKIISMADGKKECSDDKCKLIEVSKYLHLLLFHSLSAPNLVEHGLNDFIEFNPEFVEDIYEKFMTMIPQPEEDDEADNQE